MIDSDDDIDAEDGDDVVAPRGVSAVVGPQAFVVALDTTGIRLDAWLPTQMQGVSRSRVAGLVDDGHVTVDGKVVKSSHKLRGGEKIAVVVPAPAPTTLVPQDLPLVLVYDDDDLCVIDKAAGMVVHPGAGHDDGTVANALLHRFPNLSIGGERRPGIVHRLDKDTSGLLLVAKNDETQRALARLFHDRHVDKRYVALCLGIPHPTQSLTGTGGAVDVVTGHRRANSDRRRFTTRLPPPDPTDLAPNKTIRRAHSRFTVRAERDGVAIVDVELLTGRTHQIRAHLADLGHPLLQDDLYGGGNIEKRLKPGPVRDAVVQLRRQALHAATLGFAHPRTGTQLRFSSPLPADLAAVVDVILAR